jgi:hypothetical protein
MSSFMLLSACQPVEQAAPQALEAPLEGEAADDGTADTAHASAPPQGEYTPIPAPVAETPVRLSTALSDALRASQTTSDSAASEYDMKLEALRRQRGQATQEIRTVVSAAPVQAHSLRQALLTILGEVGGEPSDASLLSKFAARALYTGDLTPNPESDADDLEEQRVTAWVAERALVVMLDRGSKSAIAEARALLRAADPDISFVLAVEMQERGIFSENDRKVLEARSISPAYEIVRDLPKLDVETLGSQAVPPPAQ